MIDRASPDRTMSPSTHDNDTLDDNTLDNETLEAIGHPRGTMAILLIYALAFAGGWLLLYLGAFMPRGVPQ